MLADPATGTRVVLESDPGVNAAVFMRFTAPSSSIVVAVECAHSATWCRKPDPKRAIATGKELLIRTTVERS